MDDGEMATTRALTVETGVTRVEFDEFKEGRALYCRATQEGIKSEIKALKNLFVGAIGLSTAIVTVWQYFLHVGAI